MEPQVRLGKDRLIENADAFSCAEPEPDSTPPAILLPLNDGSEYPVTVEQCHEWAGLYPAVDVMQQLRGMRGWLDANPQKRKTRRGIKKFVNSWLSREQDRGGRVQKHSSRGVQQDKPFYEAEQPEYLKYLNTELTPEEKAILGEG